MTDPLRRDPREFLRVLKKMSQNTSWHKTMIFASKARMVGYPMSLQHYNMVLFSQSLWGRALEITHVIRAMQHDEVRPDGVSYYYICNGMANADHGWSFDFPVNRMLPGLQHWRVALNALQACEHNGYDATDTMHNAVLATCVTPGIDKWTVALGILNKMRDEERRPHPQMLQLLEKCLVKHMRPREAGAVVRYGAEEKVQGYEERWEPDVFRHLPDFQHDAPSEAIDDPGYREESAVLEPLQPVSGAPLGNDVFRPRVHRQLWWKWHAVANRYRPADTLKKRQLAPRNSPTGVPAFWRL